MVRLAVLSFVMLCMVMSCTRVSREAAEYNDILVSLNREVIAAEDTLIQDISRGEEKRLDTLYGVLMDRIQYSLDSARNLAPFREDTTLRASALSLLKTYRRVAVQYYPEVIRITRIEDEHYTRNDHRLVKRLAKRINSTLEAEIDSFVVAQEAFSDAYGFAVNRNISR